MKHFVARIRRGPFSMTCQTTRKVNSHEDFSLEGAADKMHTGAAIRIAVPIFALGASVIAASCGSYDAYSSLRVGTDASTVGGGGSGGNETGGGGTQSGGKGDGGAAEAGDGDASTESSTPPPPLADIVDGGTLKPLPTVSSCGWHTDSVIVDGKAKPRLIVDFGCPDVLQDFQFVDIAATVKGDWVYETGTDPNLGQQANPISYPAVGVIAVVSGSKALYMPKVIHDGLVSAHVWSTDDDDSACIAMRYQDELHYYRACLYFPSASQGLFNLLRIAGNQVISLGTYKFPSITGHSPPGHVIGVEAVGQSFRAYLDGTQVLEYDDPGGYSFGRVGVEDVLLRQAHFDDFTVVEY